MSRKEVRERKIFKMRTTKGNKEGWNPSTYFMCRKWYFRL